MLFRFMHISRISREFSVKTYRSQYSFLTKALAGWLAELNAAFYLSQSNDMEIIYISERKSNLIIGSVLKKNQIIALGTNFIPPPIF